jgi:hypothetical protein
MRTVWIRPRDDRQFAVGLLLIRRKPGEAALICRRASSRSVPGAARRSPLPCARASRSGPCRDVRRCCSTRLDSSPSVRCGHDQPAAVLAGRPAHHRSRAFGSAPAADGRQDQGVQAHQLARAADPVHDPLRAPPAHRAACAGLPPTAGSSTCVEAHRTSGVFLPRASGAAYRRTSRPSSSCCSLCAECPRRSILAGWPGSATRRSDGAASRPGQLIGGRVCPGCARCARSGSAPRRHPP